MPTTIILPDNYGYAALVALGIIPVLSLAQGAVVTEARKKARVPYPNAYATAEQAKSDSLAHKFNCAQRAHGNLIENLPVAIATILFSGLYFPVASASLGAIWAVNRALYAYGYITSTQPNGGGRKLGGLFWLAQIGLIGLSIATALKTI